MRGRHSEAGKEELGPYIRGKDESCSIKGHTSALNSPPDLKNHKEGRWFQNDLTKKCIKGDVGSKTTCQKNAYICKLLKCQDNRDLMPHGHYIMLWFGVLMD